MSDSKKKAGSAAVNREQKDRLFRLIFGSAEHKDWLLSLYNALNGSDYSDPDQLVINTLKNTVYLGMKNDVSFLINDTLNLYEQQSSFNPNMPLRSFMYLSNLYSGYVDQEGIDLYRSALAKVPTPYCVCFYNGLAARPEEETLKLSDMFTKPYKGESMVELVVKMININYGRNMKLLNACRPLLDYSLYVKMVRENVKNGMALEKAVDQAIDAMPADSVISSYLKNHRAEVKNVSIFEYNEAEHLRNTYEDGYDEGVNYGLKEGIKVTIELNHEINRSRQETAEYIMKKFSLDSKQAEEYLKAYWPEQEES